MNVSNYIIQSHIDTVVAIEKGYMPRSMVKVLLTASDDRVCLSCAKLEGLAIGMDDYFLVDGQEFLLPPFHDHCRCTLLYEESPEPQARRDYNSLILFSNMANDSSSFEGSVVGYYATIYFLEKLIACPASDFSSAGLEIKNGASLEGQLQSMKLNKDSIFNGALRRAYDYQVENAKSLKTDRGRRARIDRWVSGVLESESLTASNYEFLYDLTHRF